MSVVVCVAPSYAPVQATVGVWHCVFFRNKVWLTYYCPALHRRGVLRWCDLISGSKIPPQLLGTVAPTWRAIYEESALRVVGMYEPNFAVPATPPVDNWSLQWAKRRTLLAMQQRTRHEARQPEEVWRVFGCLHLPKWDLDFIRRVLWRKLPVGARMERLGGKLCPQCGRVEDHAHTLKRCYFSAFMFDTVRKAFGLAQGGGGAVEPSRLLLEEPLLSLQTTQGLVLWAGLRAQWKLRCEVKYQHRQVSLEEFVAVWVGVLEIWRGERNMSCSRVDLRHLIAQLHSWADHKTMFHRAPQAPTTAKLPSARPDPLKLKEAKWGSHKRSLLAELEGMSGEGWVIVYTDGSAKRVRGWMQAGYGVWFGDNSNRNFRAHVPAHERQSISRGELRGVLHAMLSREAGERMVVVVDSEYIFKAITVWTDKWKRHGWRTSLGEVGHRDLWEHIDWLRGEAGDKLQVRWVPSHLGVAGNEAADELAGQGRELHPYNLQPLSKRRRVTEWDALGLEPMAEVSDRDLGSEVDSGGTSSGSSTASSTSDDEDVFRSSSEDVSFSTDVSDTRLRGTWDSDSDGFSTDVSESRKRRRRGIES